MQAEEAAQQESAAARTPSRPRPPTIVLGYAPPSQASPSTTLASGKHSWPAHFFDDSRKKRIRQAADNEQESATASEHRDESVDSGAVSSHMGDGDSMAGDGLEKDFGAAWRDAAQSPMPSQSATPAPETGASGCLRIPQNTAIFPVLLSLHSSCCVIGCVTKRSNCFSAICYLYSSTCSSLHAGMLTSASAAPSIIPSRVY